MTMSKISLVLLLLWAASSQSSAGQSPRVERSLSAQDAAYFGQREQLLTQLQSEVTSHVNDIKQLRNELESLKIQMSDVRGLQGRVAAIENDMFTVYGLQANLSALQTQLAVEHKNVVAFQVSAPTDENLGDDSRVMFGHPSLNIGEGFQTASSAFVAPVSGVYVFFMKITSYRDHYLNIGLMLNGRAIAEAESDAGENFDRSSAQVVVQLKQNDRVWLQKRFGDGYLLIAGDNTMYNTFGGVLIYPGDSL